ncbi:MAG: FHA domain-containing protein [Planctomycetota bacterium]
MLILIVAGGPDKGRIYELFDDRDVILGRDGADLQFNDVKVSRRHARIWCDGGRWYLQDLESKHGTHRNHKEIDDVQPLKDGDYIQVGRTIMVLARMSAEHLEQATLQLPMASAHASMFGKLKPKHLAVAVGTAAMILIGLNVVSLINANRGTAELEDRIVALGEETPTQRKLHGEMRLALEAKQQHEQNVEAMIASFGPKADRLMPKLDVILATLDAQPDVAAPLAALAQAIEERDAGEQLNTKIDSALAMLEQRGGDAEALAEQFREMLAGQPTVEQIAAAASTNDAQTLEALNRLTAQLDNTAGSPVAPAALAAELAELRRLVEARPAESGDTAQLKSMLEDVLARVEALDSSGETETVLAAIAEVKTALPVDNTEAFAAVNAQLAALTEELNDRRDSELIQQQLAQLIEASKDADEAALAAASDPLLGQLLAQVETLSETDQKLDAILASLKQQPYDNRAMLDEALAQLGEDAAGDEVQTAVATLLDQTMAELRGKSITDADQLRRMIQREVAAAVGRANGEPVERSREDTRLTRTETAYKLAFESGKPVAIGVTRDPVTGQRLSGRTLDPAEAVAAGHESWRDWYLMDDLANRMQLQGQAQRVVRGQRDNTQVLSAPSSDTEASDLNIHASPAPE